MRDYDIKFVNKEITPFGGLSLFLKMLEKCHFGEQLEKCGLPSQGSNRGYKPLQLILGLFAGVWCGASRFGQLDAVVMTQPCAIFWDGSVEQTTGLTSAISTSSRKPSTSVCLASCSNGSFPS